MVVSFEQVLDKLGWKDGFRIPVANEENKHLEIDIEKKNKRKAHLILELERSQEHIKAMEKHSKHLESEHDYNQNLITAQAAQLEAEDHLARLCWSNRAANAQKIRKLQKEKQELRAKNVLLQKELAKIDNRINESQKAIEFDKAKLFELEESLNREEEKNQKIESFIKIDGKHFKKLQLDREKLVKDLENHKKAVIRVVNEVNEMEIMLDRTARIYVQTLKEQSQLINCWNQSVLVLRQRDNAIQEMLKEIRTYREDGCLKIEDYKEAEQFLEIQINDNKQLEDTIRKLERKLAAVKDERSRISLEVQNYQIELKSQQKTLESLIRQSRQVRIEAKKKRMEMGKKRRKVDEIKKQIEKVASTVKDIGGKQNLNVDDGSKQLEEMIEKEEKRKTRIAKETSRLQNFILRKTSQISDLESEKKMLELRKKAELKKAKLLAEHRIREQKLLSEKKKMIYQLDIDIEKGEMRLDRATGACTGVDKAEIEKKMQTIANLEKVLAEKLQVNKLLQGQIASLEYDMRKMSVSLSNDKDELNRLLNKKQDFCLLIEGGNKKLKSMISQNEEKQVEENILSLRISQAERLLANVGNKVYNLDKYRLHMEAAMKERKAEIQEHKEALILEKRLAINENSELRASILERKSRVQHLQTRYDTCLATIGKDSEGPDGSSLSTLLITQRAQEKFMLQEQGDKLDALIRKTEQEICSMENTLRVVNACNDKYKMNLGPVDENGTEQAEKTRIDEEMYRAIESMRQRREQLEQTKADLEKMQSNYQTSLEDVQRVREEKDNKLWAVTSLERQITEQKERILRADKCLKKLLRDIQQTCECTNDEMILLQEKDIATRELQEQNFVSLQRITELTIRHVEIEAYLKKLLASKNINLPSVQHLKPTPSPSRCDTTSETTERTRSRASILSTSRESVGRFKNIEPEFSAPSVTSTRKNVSPAQQSSRSTARSQELQRITVKHLLSRNK